MCVFTGLRHSGNFFASAAGASEKIADAGFGKYGGICLFPLLDVHIGVCIPLNMYIYTPLYLDICT